MEFRKTLKITLYAEQKKRHRFIDHSFLRLHPSTAFQTLVDYHGYSISSKGFLPTVVDIMVIYHCTITLPRQALHNQVSSLLRNSEIITQRTFLAKVFQSQGQKPPVSCHLHSLSVKSKFLLLSHLRE